jgi:hypothetical protein
MRDAKKPKSAEKKPAKPVEVEPPLHKVLVPHEKVLGHRRDFPQPDIITKVHFDDHNSWQKVSAKIEKEHPTIRIHGRHPIGKGLIIRATSERAKELSTAMQRRVEYLGSYTNYGGRHEPGHYWQVHPVKLGTRIVGNAKPKPQSNVHPRMADRRQDVMATRVKSAIDTALKKRAAGPTLTALPGGQADEMIRDVLIAGRLVEDDDAPEAS